MPGAKPRLRSDDTLFSERFVLRPRHIEAVLADAHGERGVQPLQLAPPQQPSRSAVATASDLQTRQRIGVA